MMNIETIGARILAIAVLVSLAACSDETTPGDDALGDDAPGGRDTETEPGEADFEGLTATQLLVRASLDLRGVRPSVEELAAVEADEGAIDTLTEGFVDDSRFGDRMGDVFAGAWRTRIDSYEGGGPEFIGGDLPRYVGDEPSNLIAFIALNDRPYTDLVDSEYTYVAEELATLWGLETVAAGEDLLPAGTVRGRYVDGRPQQGVLSMNSVFWRTESTIENANRGRANALSSALLCQSFLDRPIDFPTDLDLTDSESIRNAIRTDPACQGCHSTLDPLASYLWGYMYPEAAFYQSTYDVPGELGWTAHTGVEPGYFGRQGSRMTDLAGFVAADERFVSCAVQTVYEGMMGRPVQLADEGALAEHREDFLASGLSLKSLVLSILRSPTYRGMAYEPRFGGSPAPVQGKVVPVEVMSSAMKSLTGYELRYFGREAMTVDFALRRLAGGSDRGSAYDVSTGAVLVQRRLAEGGAVYAVQTVLDGGQSSGLLDAYLRAVDLSAEPTAEDLASLVALVRSRQVDPSDEAVTALATLWRDAQSASSATDAWATVLTAVLADPDLLLY
ncbi:MAG: hypothetical protein AAGF11_41080 [Myxococcota bacterium]